MLLSKSKKPKDEEGKVKRNQKDLKNFENFIRLRDFAGALTVLAFQRKNRSAPEAAASATDAKTPDAGKSKPTTPDGTPSAPTDPLQIEMWTAYCQFHAGDYQAALETLKQVKEIQLQIKPSSPHAAPSGAATKTTVARGVAAVAAATAAAAASAATASWLQDPGATENFMACCCLYLGMYEEAEQHLKEGRQDPLSNRLKFHLAFKKGDEKDLFAAHKNLTDNLEDQLTLASMHYLRGHYDKALDSYKQIYMSALGKQKLHALEIYMGMCLFKMDENESAMSYVMQYLKEFPDSVVANNLKACIDHKLFSKISALEHLSGIKAAMPEHMKFGRELVQHNEAVFAEGASPMKALQPLVGVIPEAKINLAIHHLRNNEVKEAQSCLAATETVSSAEHVLKASVYTFVGQERADDDLIDLAKSNFKVVGESPNDRDTILGRQCMASYYILNRMYEEALVYLKSIKPYMLMDDTFNMNYAQCLAAVGDWSEMDESLSNISSKTLRDNFIFKSLALKCNIMNKKPHKAWAIYTNHQAGEGALIMLQMLAAECYRTGQFVFAARGYALLLSMSDEEVVASYRAGLRGAVVGTFQQILAGEESEKTTLEILELISVYDEHDAKLAHIGTVIGGWAKEQGIIRA